MSQAAAIHAVRERFREQVAEAEGIEPVFDNGPPGTNSDGWVRVSVSIESAVPITFGRRRWRATGAMTVTVHVPVEKGDKRALELAQATIDAFTGVSIATPQVRFQAASLVGIPANDGTGWFNRTVRVPFTTDYEES